MSRKTIKRSRDDLILALEIQKQAIAASCEGYDKGNTWEAMRLATCVHTILHDSRSIISIATQLGIKGALRFVSYAAPRAKGSIFRHEPLVFLRFGPGNEAKYLPHLNNGPIQPKSVQFHTWWEDEEIIYDPDSLWLNRRRLVFSMRNQDGGAHLDNELTDQAYIRVKQGKANVYTRNDGVLFIGSGQDGKRYTAIFGSHHASMRHIAWELLKSLEPIK